jgi:RNA methyltransferase, TrmH family
VLTHRQRQELRQLQSRHGRRQSELFVAEGLRACTAAVTQQPQWLEAMVCTARFAAGAAGRSLLAHLGSGAGRAALTEVSEEEFASLAATENPQGVLCVLRRPDSGVPSQVADPFVLVLDRVREPGNLGTILRTAWAVGLRQVWLTADSADPFEAKVVRAGMGAQFGLRLVQAGPLAAIRDQLAERGRQPLYLTVPRAGVSCFAPEFSLAGAALVIGNEAEGITDLELGPHVTIPMPGAAESLNAAQAATVLLFDAVRRGVLQ